MFLSKTEQAYLNGTSEFTKPQARSIRYRINKKLKLLGRDGVATGAAPIAASEFRDGMNKNGTDSLLSQVIAPSNFYAPRSGRKQCEQDPCWKAYGNSSHRIWQTASSG